MAKKKINIRDYLHLYIGCEFEHTDDYFVASIRELTGWHRDRWNENCKLILRPLRSMTSDEAEDIQETMGLDMRNWCTNPKCALTDQTFHYNVSLSHWMPAITMMLKMGFDLFGLIDAGIAIDKTKLKPTTNAKG